MTTEARQACQQLLGPAPEHPLHDFLRYGPPDLMGVEAAMKWQERYRKQKEKEAEEQVQEQPKKRTRKGREK